MTDPFGFVSLYFRMSTRKFLPFLALFLILLIAFPFAKKAESIYVCNASCALNVNGCDAPNTCYIAGGTVCRNPDCLNQPSCTCPNHWTKLKDTSFFSGNALNNPIPAVISAYDSSDTTTRYFIINSTNYDPGIVAAPSIELNNVDPSSKKWQTTLTSAVSLSTSDFLNYVKSRKDYHTITNFNDINTNNYNNTIVVSNTGITLDDTNKSNFDNKNLVVVVDGDLTFNATAFTPTNAATAFIVTGTITFAPTTTEADAILVAPAINLGTTTNQGLKIVGNLSTSSLTNGRLWTDNSKPSFFVVFNYNPYITLLPLLSTTDYNWQQLQ